MVGGLGVYLAGVVVLCTIAVACLDMLLVAAAGRVAPLLAASTSSSGEPRKVRAALLADNDDWMATVRTERFWQANRKGRAVVPVSEFGGERGSRSEPPAPAPRPVAALAPIGDASRWYDGDGDTHRTVCVRLCDGYFWPVSYSTTSDNFERDGATCARSCASPARLFVHRTPGGSVEDMADVKGQPYARLPTAFLFRTRYEDSCKCKPHPWEPEAMERHRLYALDAHRRTGGKLAALAPAGATDADAGSGAASGSATSAKSTTRKNAAAQKPSRKGAAANPSRPRRAAVSASSGEMMQLGANAASARSRGSGTTVAARGDWRQRSFDSGR